MSERFDRYNLAARLEVASFSFEISNPVLFLLAVEEHDAPGAVALSAGHFVLGRRRGGPCPARVEAGG